MSIAKQKVIFLYCLNTCITRKVLINWTFRQNFWAIGSESWYCFDSFWGHNYHRSKKVPIVHLEYLCHSRSSVFFHANFSNRRSVEVEIELKILVWLDWLKIAISVGYNKKSMSKLTSYSLLTNVDSTLLLTFVTINVLILTLVTIRLVTITLEVSFCFSFVVMKLIQG